jgi:DNA-binding transcriptional LysR family regulator
MPELSALDLFVTVVETGSVSRAASAHGISQPSGSVRIARLERQLGVTLLRRTPGGSKPTEAGLMLAGWARAVLEAAQRFDAAVVALKVEEGGRLRLAASYTIAEYLLPGWLSVLAPRLSATAVELNVANSTVVMSRALRGAVDLGFVESETVDDRLETRIIGHDELAVVVHPDHPWARRRQPLDAVQLACARLVMRERGSGTREVLERALEPMRPSAAPTPLLELGSTTAVKAAVLDNVGPAVVSALAVQTEIENGQLRRISVADLDLRRFLRATWVRGTSPPPAARLLIQHAVASTAGDQRTSRMPA